MPVPTYDAIAEWYEESFVGGSPVHALAIPAMRELIGPIAGQVVCDLACGQGILARELATCSAVVTGIDLSPRLLAIAERYEKAEPLGIHYTVGNAESLDAVSDRTFDGVACCLALMDIANLEACLRTVARILRPQGWFVFAITHPCFQMPDARWTGTADGPVKREVGGYFHERHWCSENPHGVRGQVGAHHRTLSTYINALSSSGLMIEAMREPQAQEEVARRVPGYYEVPAVLVVRCRKGD